MADDDYDPLDPPTFNAGDDNDDSYDPAEVKMHTADDDDEEDYDPDSFGFADTAVQPEATPAATASVQASQQTSRAPSTAPNAAEQSAKPRTVGGFIMDESDDEEERSTQNATPVPSQLNGTAGSQSGLGAAAVSNAQDVTLGSEPTPDAVAALNAQQTTGLTGSIADAASTSAYLPASVPSVASHTPVPVAPSLPAAVADGGNVPPASVQPSVAPTPVPEPVNGTATSQIPPPRASIPQRLAHDKVGQLEDRIKDDPKADTDAWMSLIAYYKEKEQLDNVRRVYERFFQVFPTAAKVWLEFANFEQDNDETARVEQILGMALGQLLDVDMWLCYLNLVRRRNPLISDSDGSKRALIQQVFEVVLDKVGIDPDAGDLWREYVEFMKSWPGNISGSGWQDLQKVDLLRKAYQRAIVLPHEELMKLWKEYDSFELSLNRSAGRKNLNEQGPAYMTAKGARMQLDNKLAGLDRRSLPKLPPVYGCAGDDEFGDQVERWRAWIEWEKADELVLKDENGGVGYRARVVYVFKQATMALHFYPEIWYDAASWCYEQETPDMVEEGDKFLDAGIKANPESVLLALKKADRVETALPASTSDEIAIENGKKVDIVFEAIHASLYALRDKYNEREKLAQAQVHEHFASLTPEEPDDQDGDDGDAKDKPKSRQQLMDDQLKAVKATFDGQREVLKRTISYVWSAKMRAFRRIQGQGLPKQAKKGFRGVFAEARPRGMLTSDVYVASALLEHHCYRDPAATRIFDRGLKLFPVDELFALEYLKHLISINDLTNAKAVFETTLTKIQNTAALPEDVRKEKCRPLLGYMHHFESNYGDLAQIHKLEKRMAEMFPQEPDLLRFSNRFETPTFDALKTQLAISPAQTQPKASGSAFAPSQQPAPFGGPSGGADIRLGPHGPYIASPKRGLDDSFSDTDSPQRKKLRGGDSPTRRGLTVPISNTSIPVQQQGGGGGGFMTKNYIPGVGPAMPPPPVQVQALGPAPLPREIAYVLSILPNARDYLATRIDGGKLVGLMQRVDVGGGGRR